MSAIPAAASSSQTDTLTREDKLEIATLLKKEGLITKTTRQGYTRAGFAAISAYTAKDPSTFRFTLEQALAHFPESSLKTNEVAKEKIKAIKAATHGESSKSAAAAVSALTASREKSLEMCAVLINHGLASMKAARSHFKVGSDSINKYRTKAQENNRFTPQYALQHVPKELLKKDRLAQEKIKELNGAAPAASPKAEEPKPAPAMKPKKAQAPKAQNSAAPAAPPKAKEPKPAPDIRPEETQVPEAQAPKEAPPAPAVQAAAEPAAPPKPASPEPEEPPLEITDNFVHYVNLYRAEEITLDKVLIRCGMEEAEFKRAAKKVPICDRKAVDKAIAIMMPERLAAAAATAVATALAAPLPKPLELLPLPPLPIPSSTAPNPFLYHDAAGPGLLPPLLVPNPLTADYSLN